MTNSLSDNKDFEGDVRALYDKKYLGAWDLPHDVVVTIERVERGAIEDPRNGGKVDKKPLVHFVGKSKPLVLNQTNRKTLEQLFGSNKARDWKGKKITLYATQTSVGGRQTDCVRIRNVLPKAEAAK